MILVAERKVNTLLCHLFFFCSSSAFQGGAEHNVPVVISKIFKDQVGKKVFEISLLHFWKKTVVIQSLSWQMFSLA